MGAGLGFMGESNDYVGWAPLPPEARFDQRTGIRNWSDNYYDVGPDQYCFVASLEFGAPRVERMLLPPERNVTIINQTTKVTNITYNDTTIVNEGPSYDELRALSREPIQRYRLERNVNVEIAAEPPRPEVRGETVVIATPVITAPVANERPPTVKQTVAVVAIDLGWAAIANQEEAEKTRQKMKSEATPPPNAPPRKFVKTEAATNAPAQSADTSATSTSTTATPAPSVATTVAPAATASTPISTPGFTNCVATSWAVTDSERDAVAADHTGSNSKSDSDSTNFENAGSDLTNSNPVRVRRRRRVATGNAAWKIQISDSEL